MNGSSLQIEEIAARSGDGFGIFPGETVERINFIQRAQEMGCSLEEAKQLFSTGGEAVRAADKKLADLEAKINQMRNFKKFLNHHLADCGEELKAHGKQAACPVLATIEGKRLEKDRIYTVAFVSE